MTVEKGTHSGRPIPGPARDYHFPAFTRQALTNGLGIIVAPIRRLPVVSVLAVVDGGALWDEAEREGTASLTAKLLLEGAGDLDGAALTERFEQLGASIEAGADWDGSVVSMTVTSRHLAEAMGLFAQVLRQPTFKPREVERIKAERLADLLQLRAEPRGLADEAFESAVYHPTSRYSKSLGGSEASVQAIASDDIRRLYSSRYSPRTTTLVITGDISEGEAVELARKYFDDWSGNAGPTESRADRPARDSRATHLVVRPDSPQSELRIGHVGIPRTHPDYFDVVVMNAILGGLFNSRINLNLREAHAYTYSAFSGFDWRRDAGPFVASSAVRTDVTVEAITEIIAEIERMRREGVTEDELTLAKSYLDGVFPIRYETTSAVAAALANQLIFGLPHDYFDTYRDNIRRVSAESVHRVAEEHLRSNQLQVVVVGDPSVEDKLRALQFGEFIQREAVVP
jgi:zinc protease